MQLFYGVQAILRVAVALPLLSNYRFVYSQINIYNIHHVIYAAADTPDTGYALVHNKKNSCK